MKAVVFRGKGQIAIEDVPKPVPGPGEAVIKITATTICGTDVHIVRGEYPVKPGLVLGHEPVGVIEELGAGTGPALPNRRAGDRRRDYAVRPMFLLSERLALAMRRSARRLALRQHDQRRLGRISARAGRAREPGAYSTGSRRRIRADVSGYLLDRSVRRRKRQHQSRRLGCDLCAGPDRPVRHARRETEGRRPHHRHRRRRRRGSRPRVGSARP